MEQGQRKNEGKVQWSLVDFESFEDMVKVLEFGLKKYSKDNWKKGGENFKSSKICESLLRHIFSYMKGEVFDKETGLSHLAHAQCNLMFLEYYRKNNPELNDFINNK